MTTRRPTTAEELAVLRTEFEHMSAKIGELSKTVEKLAEVDQGLRMVIRVVKWVVGILAGVGSLWGLWHAR